MNIKYYSVPIKFILLAAIWGGSFLFMRVTAPVIGGFWTAELRLAIGTLVLLIFMAVRRLPLQIKHWNHYVVVGLLNCALPFTLFGLAGRILPAGYSAVLNSTVPFWVCIFGVWLLKSPVTKQNFIALCVGIVGVVFVAQPSSQIDWSSIFIISLIGCCVASASYGLATIYSKTQAVGVSSQAMATMSQLFGAIFLLPFAVIFNGEVGQVTLSVIVSILLLGILCSGAAFLLFYGLVDEVGPLMASSVTFVVPLFGIFWGWLFLNERLDWHVMIGCAFIIGGALLLYRSSLLTQKNK